ncbi:MAG: O-antigen ligase family protein [Elusimicrobiota bacterium]
MLTAFASGFLCLLLAFASFEKGGHDLWAATAIYLASLGLGALTLFRFGWKRDSEGLALGPVLPLLGIALALTLSFLQSVNPSESFMGLADWIASMLLFWVGLHLFRSKRGTDVLLVGAAPILWIHLLIILGQKLFIPHLRHQTPGALGNANLTAAFLVLWTAPFLARTRESWRSGPVRYFWASTLAALLAGILLLASHWAVLCLLLGLPWTFGKKVFQEFFHRHRRLVLGSAGAACVLFAAALLWKFGHRFDEDGNPVRAGTHLARLFWWDSGLGMFWDHPWLGVGIGNYPSAYLAYKSGAVQNTLYAHSLFVSILAETGVLGALSLLFFAFRWLRGCWAHREALSDRWPFLLGAGMFLFYGTISLSVEYLSNLLAFWLFLAAAAAPAPDKRTVPRRTALLLAATLTLVAIPFAAAPLFASRDCVAAEDALAAGRLDDAAKGFVSAASLDPLSSDAHRGMAKTLYADYLTRRDRRSLAPAISHQREAVRLNRLSAGLWRELSFYLREQGKQEQAVAAMEKAATLRPGDRGLRAEAESLRSGVSHGR